MPVASNRYYNDPAIGQAFSNLAGMFAPPSGGDLAGYATAKAKREEASRLAELFAYAKDPAYDQTTADRMGVLGGLYAPNQSFYSVDQGNAVARRGQDITASTALQTNAADNIRALEDRRMQEAAAMERLGITDATTRRGDDLTYNASRENNTADNVRALEQTRLGNTKDVTTALLAPVGQGETRFVPSSIADMYSLPETQTGVVNAGQGERLTLPDGRVIAGAEKPLTREQVEGQIVDALGVDDKRRVAMDSVQVEQIIGPDGKPQISFRTDAADAGAAPYVKPTNDSMSPLARLLAERDALPQNDPRRAAYDQNIAALGRGQKQSKYDETVDENDAKLGDDIFNSAKSALADRGTYATVLAAVDNPNVDQGTLSNATLSMRKALNAFGIDGGNTGPAEMLNALGNQISLRLRDPSSGAGMPGAMSDADREFLKSMSVSLGNSPEANRLLAQYYMAIQQRSIDLELLRQDYVEKNGRVNEGFRQQVVNYMQNNDPTKALQQRLSGNAADQAISGGSPAAPTPAPAAPPAPAQGEMLDGFRFKGGDPADPNSWEPVQ